MTKFASMAILAAGIALAGCQMTSNERSVAGGLMGAAGGLAVANLLGANTNWAIIGTVAGAAAGTLLARNTQTGTCAYARGDGTYYEAPCP
ncbi:MULTISPECIES: glycine zipper 2TM domain-containing protein [Roseinatronobacter]|uniref:17 kDa surface antigen n=1 Tax=Roseinatronobacter domitianus TaxID=2940293 RepID=A0ABT0M4E5_9RHOB|nr:MULTISPECIES: glycine zipper 2TM domain-containing protein [Roseibaca]MCL1629742.1 glycine zipper 2TM domain-containing protein [Roseibaca domitiana]